MKCPFEGKPEWWKDNMKNEFVNFLSGLQEGVNLKSIEPIETEGGYVPSFAQRRSFFYHEFGEGYLAINQPFLIDIFEKIDLDGVRDAINQLIHRHEILRTSLEIVNGELTQKIATDVSVQVKKYTTTEGNTKSVVENIVQSSNVSDISQAYLIQEADDRFVLILSTRNISLDSESRKAMTSELRELYHGKVLASVKFQYKEYALWQQNNIASAAFDDQREFWAAEFEGNAVPLALPTDYARPLSRSYFTNTIDFHLSKKNTAKLKSIAEKSGVELFIVTLAIYNVLLNKLSNQQDVVVGMFSSDRVISDMGGVVGDLENFLPIRHSLEGEQTFSELLKNTKAKLTSCFKNGLLVSDFLTNSSSTALRKGASPLSDTVFYPFDQRAAINGGATWSTYSDYTQRSFFDLALSLLNTEDEIQLSFEYAIELFQKETLQRFVTYYKNIVSAVVEEEQITINQIGIITEEEKHQLLHEFNTTDRTWPENESIVSLFEQQVNLSPEQIAIRHRKESISYSKLNTKTNQLASLLKDRGVQRGDIVMLFLERSVEYIAATLAVLKSGAVYIPVDLNNPDERVNFILKDSDTQFILTEHTLIANRGIELPKHTICLDEKGFDLNDYPSQFSSIQYTCDHIYAIYTSGSTGRPKGVIGSQKGLLNRLYWGWTNYPFAKQEVCCQKTSVSFIDHITEVLSPLLKGIPLVILDDEEVIDTHQLLNILKANNISRITLVPSLLRAVLHSKRKEKLHLASLKYVFCSGDALSTQLANDFYDEFSHSKLFNVYGATEVSADATAHYVNRFDIQEILKYFKNLSDDSVENMNEFDGVTLEKKEQELFTAPNVSLQALAEKFTDSQIATYPMSLEKYYDFFEQEVMPYTIDTASPTFIGHMTSVLPDYVHDLSKLISQMNQNLVKIETSKSITFVEREAVAILHRLFYEMSSQFYDEHIQKVNSNLGIITSGGTIANISALLTARNKGLFKSLENRASSDQSIYALLHEQGYKDMVFIGTRLMHYSFKKALSILGLGARNMMFVENDEGGVMITSDLQDKIDYCRKEKLLIIAIVGIAGSTERGSIDPLPELGEIAKKNDIHFHVDAAWGGALMFSDKYKHLLKGVEAADSITFCGHKQLFLPQGISVCLFRDPSLLSFNATTANYQAQPNSYDFGRFTIEGSRPALSICLHASLRILGQQGFGMLVENGIENAKIFASLIKGAQGFQLLSRHMNIINYRYVPMTCRARAVSDKLTDEDINRLNEVNEEIQQYQFYQGETFVSKTTIKDYLNRDIIVFRVVLSNPLTTHEDLVEVMEDQIDIIKTLYGEENNLIDHTSVSDVDVVSKKLVKPAYRMPIGKPIDNTKILILGEHNCLQPVGVPGEICISGYGLTSGYLNNEALTKKKMEINPFFNGEIMYRTGDLGRWNADGNIEYIGRKDNQVQIRGNRVELIEIESVLNEHELIKESTVLVAQGEDEKQLIAFITANGKVESRSIKSHLSGKLPGYMIPSNIISLDKIPLTISGKVHKKHLLEQWTQGVFKRERFLKPGTTIEMKVAQIWSENLGLDSISLNDTFFDLGGHSLLLIRALKDINKHFEISLPLNICYLMTLEQTAQEIDDRLDSLKSINKADKSSQIKQ